MLARVLDFLEPTQWHLWVDKVRVALDEPGPFVVPGHGNWASAQLLDCVVYFVRIALQDVGECIVGFLDLADYD